MDLPRKRNQAELIHREYTLRVDPDPPVTVHDWQRTLNLERKGEFVLDALFGSKFIIVQATKAHQLKQKIDRFLVHNTDGRLIYRVDYKTDFRAAETGNLAIEHISVQKEDHIEAMGWIHTTIADLIVYYVPGFDTVYVMKVKPIRERYSEIQQFPLKKTGSSRNGRFLYNTYNYCVPISWLKSNGFIQKELRAVMCQGRLPLQPV
jgi:hypothetical protein